MPAEAAYLHITNDLRQQIEGGAYAWGDKLPVQEDLAAHYGVSTQPVKAALMALELTGYVERRRGRQAVVVWRPAAE